MEVVVLLRRLPMRGVKGTEEMFERREGVQKEAEGVRASSEGRVEKMEAWVGVEASACSSSSSSS